MDNDFEPVATMPLVGGEVCLDFSNTASRRGTPEPRERLTGYRDLVVWAERVGVLEAGEASGLRAEALRRPEKAADVLAQAVVLREAIYTLFSASASGATPDARALSTLNGVLAEVLPWRRVDALDGVLEWRWHAPGDVLEAPLGPIAWSAAELLTSPDRTRVKECTNASCSWLFVDASKNRSRRWCDMKDCGNRAKARRHYARRRGGGSKEGARGR